MSKLIKIVGEYMPDDGPWRDLELIVDIELISGMEVDRWPGVRVQRIPTAKGFWMKLSKEEYDRVAKLYMEYYNGDEPVDEDVKNKTPPTKRPRSGVKCVDV